MKKQSLILLALVVAGALISCSSRSNKQPAANNPQQLIEEADHFQVDTIVAAPTDTLVDADIDAVLRHYPELYRATAKAQKAYRAWATLVPDASDMNVDDLLRQALSSSTEAPADITWPEFAPIDSLYRYIISETTDAAAKQRYGYAWKAFQAYVAQLRLVHDALPADCRPRFVKALRDCGDIIPNIQNGNKQK